MLGCRYGSSSLPSFPPHLFLSTLFSVSLSLSFTFSSLSLPLPLCLPHSHRPCKLAIGQASVCAQGDSRAWWTQMGVADSDVAVDWSGGIDDGGRCLLSRGVGLNGGMSSSQCWWWGLTMVLASTHLTVWPWSCNVASHCCCYGCIQCPLSPQVSILLVVEGGGLTWSLCPLPLPSLVLSSLSLLLPLYISHTSYMQWHSHRTSTHSSLS